MGLIFVFVCVTWAGQSATLHAPGSLILCCFMLALSVFVIFLTLGPFDTSFDQVVNVAIFGLALATYVVCWAVIYHNVALTTTKCFLPAFTHQVDSLYFTITAFVTVGFGDIKAASTTCRWLVSGQLVVDFAILAVAVTAIVSRLSNSESKQGGATKREHPASSE